MTSQELIEAARTCADGTTRADCGPCPLFNDSEYCAVGCHLMETLADALDMANAEELRLHERIKDLKSAVEYWRNNSVKLRDAISDVSKCLDEAPPVYADDGVRASLDRRAVDDI